MKPIDRYLDILGVPRGVSKDELKTAYRALVRISHPDRFHDDEALKKKAEQQTKLLNEAYKYLLNHLEKSPKPGPSARPAGQDRPAEDRTGKGRDEEEKKRQDAEYRKRKAQREAREALQAKQFRAKRLRDAQTWVLGIAFAVLLFLYAAYARRQAIDLRRAEMPVEAAEIDQEHDQEDEGDFPVTRTGPPSRPAPP
jgi:curved DNA-binding protein CbpA